MDIRVSLQKRLDEIKLVKRYLSSVLKDSISSSVSWWLAALGLVFVATIFSMVITFQRDGKIEINNFFPPNFGWGGLIVLIAVFIYQLMVNTAQKINGYRVMADKYTWNDIEIKVIQPNDGERPNLFISIKNNKPFDIKKARVLVSSVTEDWLLIDEKKLPMYLSWLPEDVEGRTEHYTLRKDSKNPELVVFAFWLSKQGLAYLMTGVENDLNYIRLMENKDYHVSVEFDGEIDGHKLDQHDITYLLRFDGKKLHVKEVEERDIA
ncbi:MAG: hypothetical protein U0V18_10060 [Anaerolineales bacterium]